MVRNRRKLGKNSQKGMEVQNLVGQLQEEFVATTKGFKDVLRVRSDLMKDKTDRKGDLLGGGGDAGGASGGAGGGDGEDVSLLGNKPQIYDQGSAAGAGAGAGAGIQSFGNRMGDQQGMGMGMGMPGIAGFGNAGPRLDLTSPMLSNKNDSSSSMGMAVGESPMQLPRPCKSKV